MTVSLTIRQKGLLLVALPLAFELGLIALVLTLDAAAERAAYEQARSKEAVSKINFLLKVVSESTTALMLYSATYSKQFRDEFLQSQNKIEKSFQKIEALIDDYPAAKQEYALWRTDTTKLTNLTGRIIYALDRREVGSGALDSTTVKAGLLMCSRQFINHADKLTEMISSRKLGGLATEETWRLWVRCALFAGVVSSILLSVALSSYFSRTIRQRIGTIAKNTEAFAQGQELNEPLSGGDEIRDLDLAFRQMASALGEARRKERAVVDNAKEIICSLNAEFQFVSVNSASNQVLGLAPSELIGKEFLSIVAANSVQYVKSKLSDLSGEMDATFFGEIPLLNFERAQVWTEWSFVWSSQEKHFFCVGHDINEKIELETLKRDFLNMVSHDLRTPITAISVFMQSLITGREIYGKLNEHGLKTSSSISNSLKRMLSLINDLLDIEKIESGRLELNTSEVSLNELIEDSVFALQPLSESRSIKLEMELSSSVRCNCDAERMSQVINNLLSNAIKFSPDSSRVLVKLSRAGNRCQVEVLDDGPGIDEEFLPNLFNRFYQVKTSVKSKIKGSGLGLALCKKVVELHGGKIGVRSVGGQGSCFWFSLPLAEESVGGA
jgi:PAS domain S-box-containing protein